MGNISWGNLYKYDMVAGVYAQLLNFTTSSGTLICPVPIQYVGTSCTLQVSVKLGTATNFRVVIFGDAIITGQTFTGLNTSTYTDVSLTFIPTGASLTIALGNSGGGLYKSITWNSKY